MVPKRVVLDGTECWSYLSYSIGCCEWAVQEVQGARLLHDLRSRVAAQLTESIVAEDNWFLLHLRIGDDEISICKNTQVWTRLQAFASTSAAL